MAGYFRVLHGWSNAISPDGCRPWHARRTGGGWARLWMREWYRSQKRLAA